MKYNFLYLLLIVIIIFSSGCIDRYNAPPPGPIYWTYYNNTTINYEGGILINGSFKITPAVEDDLRFPAAVIRTQGVSNIPTWDPTNYGYLFSPTTMNQVYFDAQFPHSRQDGTKVEPHFHWQTSDNNAGDVVWCIDYTWANRNEDFPAISTECIVDSSTLNSDTHLMTSMINISGINKTYSSMFKGRLYRDATNVLDTYPSDALLIEYDIHFYKDSLGQ